MRDIATATLTGNLTREVELRPLPSGTEVARLRVASGTRRRNGEEWVERTNYFTVEVYGPQATLCAERLGKGSRVVVDGELDWREWTDQEQNRREAVVLRARQILFERTGSTPRQRASPADTTIRRMASPVPLPGRLRRQARTTCRSDQAPKRLARPSADGRAASPHLQLGFFFFALIVDPARADYDFLGGQPLDPAKRTARGDRSGPTTFPGRLGFNRVAEAGGWRISGRS